MTAASYACELPIGSQLRASLPRIDHLDSFAIPLNRPANNIVEIYAAALDHLPQSFKLLLALRSAIVRPFGLRTVSFDELKSPIDTKRDYAVGDSLGRWTVYGKAPDEIITGANDKHLDFRVSMYRDRGELAVLSTAVMAHNAVGRMYLGTILPFHRFGVASLLTRASQSGRL